MIPYAKQSLDEDDIAAVVQVLCSDWLTTGPAVNELEKAFARSVGTKHAIAVSSGTAALHAAMFAIGIQPGDEVIVPAITFAATPNSVVYQGGKPIFADVQEDTLLIDPADAEAKITDNTKAIIAVDYAGQPADYDDLHTIAARKGIALVADACHALGGHYKGRPVGLLADLSTFSFHPVKNITCGEGGMITTESPDAADLMVRFRNHGITKDFRERAEEGSWYYEMESLGYNYRLTDIQCALGRSQLRKLPRWIERRREIAGLYDAAFDNINGIDPLATLPDRQHAYHLYVITLESTDGKPRRRELFEKLRERGIMVNVHYIPVYLHPYYRSMLGTTPGLCPTAERKYRQILSLPMFPALTDSEVKTVIEVTIESAREIGLTD